MPGVGEVELMVLVRWSYLHGFLYSFCEYFFVLEKSCFKQPFLDWVDSFFFALSNCKIDYFQEV